MNLLICIHESIDMYVNLLICTGMNLLICTGMNLLICTGFVLVDNRTLLV